MRVSGAKPQNPQANSKKQAYAKLEAIKAQRNQQKKLNPKNNPKPEAPKEKVELSPRVTVRDKEKTVISDVGPNDANDPAVQEKLRTILRTGGFNFNPQERSVLSEILGDSAAPSAKNEE